MPGAEKVTEDGKIIHSWNGPDDPDHPFNFPTWYKWVLTVGAYLREFCPSTCRGARETCVRRKEDKKLFSSQYTNDHC